MDSLIRGLRWPIISLLLVGGSHLIVEIARSELKDVVSAAVEMPLLLAAGAWAGFATVRAGGTYVHGFIAGAILGLLPVGLHLVGLGMILGRDGAVEMTSAIFGFSAVLWGSFLGSGFAVDRSSAG